MRVRVYALVRGGTSVKTFRTTQGERLHVVRRGTTAAVVSDRSTPVPPTASNLRRYDRTMREIAKRFPAVLPAASVEYKRVGLNVLVIPTYKDRVHGAISFQLKLKLF